MQKIFRRNISSSYHSKGVSTTYVIILLAKKVEIFLANNQITNIRILSYCILNNLDLSVVFTNVPVLIARFFSGNYIKLLCDFGGVPKHSESFINFFILLELLKRWIHFFFWRFITFRLRNLFLLFLSMIFLFMLFNP